MKTTPKPRATKNRSGELEPPLFPELSLLWFVPVALEDWGLWTPVVVDVGVSANVVVAVVVALATSRAASPTTRWIVAMEGNRERLGQMSGSDSTRRLRGPMQDQHGPREPQSRRQRGKDYCVAVAGGRGQRHACVGGLEALNLGSPVLSVSKVSRRAMDGEATGRRAAMGIEAIAMDGLGAQRSGLGARTRDCGVQEEWVKRRRGQESQDSRARPRNISVWLLRSEGT